MAKTRKRCRLCQSPDREQLEERLSSLQISPDELDAEMHWPSGVSSRHLRNHMDTEYTDQSNPRCALCVNPERQILELAIHEGEKSAAMEIMKRELNEVDMLSDNIHRLEEKIEMLFDEDDLNPKYIDSLTKLAKEIRESLKYMLEFKGQLVHKRQDTIIVAQMQVVQEVLAQQHPQVWLDIKGKMEEKLQ